jgi:hypothetical protein
MAGYEIEVEMRVEPERVWRALVEPDQIAQWFGWDAETLAEEIRFIFVDHASRDTDGKRIQFQGEGGGQTIEVLPAEVGSLVRLSSRSGGGADGEGSSGRSPDPIREGWTAFLYQLERYVESHDQDTRRTLYLTGSAVARSVADSVASRLPGPVWFAGEFTRVHGTGDFGPGLGVLSASAPLESQEHGTTTLTLSTWGMSDSGFFELTSDWLGWWRTLVDGGEVVVFPNVGV